MKRFFGSYNETSKSYKHMENVNSSLLGKTTIVKTLVLSKVIRLSLVTNAPTVTIRLNIKHDSKIKHDTLYNDYKNGGLKSVDNFSKIVSLQCSWIRILYDENFHPWKVIPLYLIEMHFGKNFKLYPNLDLKYFSL